MNNKATCAKVGSKCLQLLGLYACYDALTGSDMTSYPDAKCQMSAPYNLFYGIRAGIRSRGDDGWGGANMLWDGIHCLPGCRQQITLTLRLMSVNNEALATRVANLERQGNKSHPPLLSSNQRTIGWTRSAVDTDLLPNSAVGKDVALRMGAKLGDTETSSTACTATMTL